MHVYVLILCSFAVLWKLLQLRAGSRRFAVWPLSQFHVRT